VDDDGRLTPEARISLRSLRNEPMEVEIKQMSIGDPSATWFQKRSS